MGTVSISIPEGVVEDAVRGATAPPKKQRQASTASPAHPAGMLWFGGWLFTIGFAHLVWWKAILALVLWPYYLGTLLH
jgi:hypothetical protein